LFRGLPRVQLVIMPLGSLAASSSLAGTFSAGGRFFISSLLLCPVRCPATGSLVRSGLRSRA
jgi:hypothetical protein